MLFIKKICLLLLVLPISSFGYTDSDFDGVEDAKDKCPNTSVIDLVDKNGCKIEESLHHFDVILGVKSIKIEDKNRDKNYYLTIKTAQIDYFYKNFSLNITSAENDSKLEDTYVSLKYKYEYNELVTFYTSFGVILPTHKNMLNNNRTDYSISQSIHYEKNNFSLFGAYRYTFINNIDIEKASLYYQNTNSYTLGIGYNLTQELYSSISVSSIENIYQEIDNSKSTNISFLYSFDDNWFTNISYTKTYNQSTISDTLSFRIGYYY